MHEFAIAQSLVALVEKVAKENGAKKIKKIELEIGEFCGVGSESLLFCFEAASSGSMSQGAALELTRSAVERDLKIKAIEVE